jgi:O-antigen/teichoic acid export membrane protein
MNQYSVFKGILRNTAALAAARVVERSSTVVLSFFVARRLGAAGLGIYSAAMVFFGLISLAAEMGSTNYLVREIAKDRSRTSRYVVHLGIMTVMLSLIVISVSWLIVPHLGYSPELRASVYVVILAAIPGTLKTIQEAVFIAHQRVEFITYSTAIAAFAYVSIAFYCLRQGYGVVSLVTAFAVVQYIVAFCYFIFLNRYIARLRCKLSVSFAVRLINEIKVFAGSSLIAGLAARPEIVILSLFKNDAQIGFYSAALRIVDVWQLVPQTYMTNVYPVLSHAEHVADRNTSRVILEKSIKYLLAVSLPLAVGFIVAARPILALVYGAGFEPSVSALRIMAWCIPFSSLTSVLWRLLAARNQQNLLLRAQVLTTIARLSAGYGLILWLGVAGAALSTALTMLVQNLFMEFYVRRDGTRLGVIRLSWRVSMAALVMGVMAAMVVNRFPLWIVVLVAMTLYAALMVLLKAVSIDEFISMRKIWQVDA